MPTARTKSSPGQVLITPVSPQGSQLALQLFEDFPDGIVSVDQEIGYSKPKTLIQVSNLSLLTRRALNACYFLVADTQDSEDSYTVNLAYFKWLIGFESKNHKYLKDALSDAQRALVQVQISMTGEHDVERDYWTSVALLGPVTIGNGMLQFSVDKKIRAQIKNPRWSSYLSLRILAAFSSQFATEIYEKLLEFLEEGASPWIRVEDFGQWVNTKKKLEFKYIRRDLIDPALEQINRISDIRVTLEVGKDPGQRRVSKFRFLIEANQEGTMVLGSESRGRMRTIINTLKDEFGLSDRQIESIIDGDISIEKLQSAIDYTRYRINNDKAKPVVLVPKYFLSALENGYRLPKISLDGHIDGKEKNLPLTVDQVKEKAFSTPMVAEFLRLSDSDPTNTQDIWNAYCASIAGKLIAKKTDISSFREALQYKNVARSFEGFLSGKKNCSRTTPSDLVA